MKGMLLALLMGAPTCGEGDGDVVTLPDASSPDGGDGLCHVVHCPGDGSHCDVFVIPCDDDLHFPELAR